MFKTKSKPTKPKRLNDAETNNVETDPGLPKTVRFEQK